jgi:ubiquinone/menaquinone biosynthesis C-methylase UbiE
MDKKKKIKYFNSIAHERDIWKKKNWYYYAEIGRIIKFIIPPNKEVLEIGCGTGDLLAQTEPSRGVGIDFSEEMIKVAQKKYPNLEFRTEDAENLKLNEKFDYIIMSDLIGHLSDVWQAFRELRKVTHYQTRVVITYYNYLWEPLLALAEKFRLKMRQDYQNWLSLDSIENLLNLNGYEVIKKGYRFLFPKYIPLISTFLNKYIAKLPFIRRLCLIEYLVARQKEGTDTRPKEKFSCSVIVPCRNEAGNIEGVITRTPEMGKHTEIIFVDGCSNDGTVEKIEELMSKYKDQKDIKLIHQGGPNGKGDAVRKGFAEARGDILLILDADLTVPPEDLPKFYLALVEGRGEFINGSRLVYPMEKDAMRFLNKLGNVAFSLIFSWLLEQRISDTLCGTKAIFRRDYLEIAKGRGYFGNFDPFGDFDLLFGAAKANLKIVEVPIRYKQRTYGDIKIERFKHGWLLLKMCWVAFKKLKLQ